MASPYVAFWSTALVVCGIAGHRTSVLLHRAFYPSGDAAVNSLLVIRAEHLQQLAGNYSRVGFHHPGPAFFYVLGAGELVLHDLLRLGPAPYNGQLLTTNVYVSVVIGLVALCVRRCLGSLAAGLLAAVLCFLMLGQLGVFAQDWFPVLYVSAFLLFMVTGAAVAAGFTQELPVYVLAVGLLAHGHVSFLMFVGVTTLAVAFGWWHAHRGLVRRTLSAHRRAWVGSLLLAGLFALPLAVTTLRHFPEPWRSYAHFAAHGRRAPRTFGDVTDFVARYWVEMDAPLALFFSAAVAAVVLTISEKDRRRRRLFLCFYGMLVLQTVLTTYYVARGVDFLAPRITYAYVGYFYYTVPLLLLVVAAVQVALRFLEQARSLGPRAALLVRSAAAATVVVLLLVASTRPDLHVDRSSPLNQRPEGFVEATRALATSPHRASRRVGLVPVDNTSWSGLAGVAIELAREHVPFCIDETYPIWRNMYTPEYACAKGGNPWRVGVVIDPAKPLPGTVWQGLAAGHVTTVYAL
jgi:hypothetical protein